MASHKRWHAHELRNEINFDQALDFWNQNGKIECLFLWKYSRLKEEESRKERNHMWPRFATSSSLRCSFCHKPKDQVEQLLAGPRGVSICTTCVDGCQQVMRDASERSSQFPLAPQRCVIVFPLPQSQTKPASKGLRDAAQLDRHRSRRFGARGASPAALETSAESAPTAHGKGAQA